MTAPDSVPPGASRGEPKPTEVLRAAATLLAHCAGCWLDEHERATGWQVYYAIDVDVIATYMSPARHQRLGAVLSDEKEVAALLSRLLSEFVVRHVQGSPATDVGTGSLLVISPHDDELHRMLTAVQRKAEDTQIKSERLKDLEGLIRESDSEDKIAETLVNHASDLLRLLDDHGPHEELDRFGSLPRHRLLNLVHYREASPMGEFRFPVPPTDSRSPEFVAYVGNYEKWRDALERVRSATAESERPHATRRDARVLASLEWINTQIREGRRRLVLVTGSHSLFAAAADLGHLAGRPNVSMFADLFLRHPHSFLGDDSFFTARNEITDADDTANRSFRVSEWLNLLLPRFIEHRSGGRIVRLQDLRAERFVEEQQAAKLDSPVDEWNQQVRTVAAKRGIELAADDPKSRAGRQLRKLREHFRGGWSIEGIQRYLAQRSRQARNTLFMSTMYLGALQLRQADTKICGVPALRFDGPYQLAQDICDALQANMFSGQLAIDLHALYEALEEPDPEGYHAFVVHAFAYAIAGHWYGTRTLCVAALEVVESLPLEEQNYRAGREAAYLLAIAERRVATNLEDLDDSKGSLALARERENPETPDDVRFRSEELANDVARLNLATFGRQPAPLPLGRVLRELERLITAADAILLDLQNEPLKTVRAWVTRQVFTNLIDVALIAEYTQVGSVSASRAWIQKLIKRFQREGLSPDARKKLNDSLSDAIYWCGKAVFDDDPKARRAAASQLRKHKPGNERDRARLESFMMMAQTRIRN